jgi:hypothetical protein
MLPAPITEAETLPSRSSDAKENKQDNGRCDGVNGQRQDVHNEYCAARIAQTPDRIAERDNDERSVNYDQNYHISKTF